MTRGSGHEVIGTVSENPVPNGYSVKKNEKVNKIKNSKSSGYVSQTVNSSSSKSNSAKTDEEIDNGQKFLGEQEIDGSVQQAENHIMKKSVSKNIDPEIENEKNKVTSGNRIEFENMKHKNMNFGSMNDNVPNEGLINESSSIGGI